MTPKSIGVRLVTTLAVAGVAAIVAASTVSVQATTPPQQATNLVWLHKPGPNDGPLYPTKAFGTLVGGAVAVHCFVGKAGNLENCRVFYEQPTGYDFAAVALKRIGLYQLDMSKAGENFPVGSSVVLKAPFVMQRVKPLINVWPGDMAYLVSKHKVSPSAKATTAPCPLEPDSGKTCDFRLIKWRGKPGLRVTAAALSGSDQTSGGSLVDCVADEQGALQRCSITGATPKATEALRRIVPAFRAPSQTADSTSVTGGRLVIYVDWAHIHEVLSPESAQPTTG